MQTVTVVTVLGLVAFALAYEQREKPGFCRRMKRELCQCQPHGSDQCDDECSQDDDCYGQRKCCTRVCKRVCTLPPIRPTGRICPPGQRWNECPTTPPATCPPTSGYIPPATVPGYIPPATVPGVAPGAPVLRPGGTVCPIQPRCDCPYGYAKTADGRCVNQVTCPPPVPPPPPRPGFCPGIHETYSQCYRGCQGSCSNPYAEGCIVRECVRGCFCIPGFVRNLHGRCIRPTSCTPQPSKVVGPPPPPPTPVCPPDQVFSSCKRECEGSCTNPRPQGCFRACQAGCFCRSPFVRDHYGNCIDPDSCVKASTVAPICPENELFTICRTTCQSTCSNPKGENCNSQCLTGCFCINGYVRNDNLECVSFEQCPPPLPPPPPPSPVRPECESDFEEYIDCFRGCQRTCDNPTGTGCSMEECQTGCFCKPGLVLNSNGHCVQQIQCPIACSANSHYTDCIPSAQVACTNDAVTYEPDSVAAGGYDQQQQQQCTSGCACDDGYIRNRTDNNCIPRDNCRSNYGRARCGAYEDQVPCGGTCERDCAQGWGSCPSACRRRCCRRRFAKKI